MKIRKLLDAFFILCIAAVVVVGVVGCTSTAATTTTTGGAGGGALVNSDSIITAEIKAIREQTTGYPWEVDILVKTSLAVGELVNPTKDSVGKVITVKTDENLVDFKAGDMISAKVKYTGDVPKPGITLYLYDIKK